jgi:hypothetical protein
MLIYKTLGPNAQEEFSKTWGVGYALNNASEWQVREWRGRRGAPSCWSAPADASFLLRRDGQDVAITAVQTAVVLVLLDLLRITRNAPWLEEQGT